MRSLYPLLHLQNHDILVGGPSEKFNTNKGIKNFILAVYPKENDVVIDGLPDTIIPDTEVTLTCRVDRIKPKVQLVWQLQLRDEMFGKTITTKNSDGTYSQTNTITLM